MWACAHMWACACGRWLGSRPPSAAAASPRPQPACLPARVPACLPALALLARLLAMLLLLLQSPSPRWPAPSSDPPWCAPPDPTLNMPCAPSPHPLPSLHTDSYAVLASSYFRSAMVLAVAVNSHQFFLEAVFSVGVTGERCSVV